MSGEERDEIRRRLSDLNLSRRWLLAGTLGFTAAALLAACGDDDDDDDDDDQDDDDAPAVEDEPTATEAPLEPTNTPVESGVGAVVGDFSQVTQFDNPEPGSPTGSRPDELIIVWGAYQFTT